MKKIIAFVLCVLLCISVACAVVPVCKHSNYTVLSTRQDIAPREDGHEYIVYQDRYCNDCGLAIYNHIANSHLEGHRYKEPTQEHNDVAHKDIISYECSICGYRSVRYVECYGPPCERIYWSLRP